MFEIEEQKDEWYHGILRMWPAWIFSFILLGLIYFLQPQQIGVLLYKTVFITWGALAGYWVNRWRAPHDRTAIKGNTGAANRQVALMCAAMLSFALAV